MKLDICHVILLLPVTGGQLGATQLGLQLKENRAAHHTDEYEQEELIVRRGQEFELTMTFDRAFNKEADSVFLQFTTGWSCWSFKGEVT